MTEVYLLFGSNVGDRVENIVKAFEQVAERCGIITARSSLYETEAWGIKEQQAFINMAARLETELPAPDLLVALKEIEQQIGRKETVHWGPREIDIDILLYGDHVIDLPHLQIPHPRMHQRRFTLVPLNEIAGNFIHPALQKSISKLLEDCTDTSAVTVVK